MKVQSVVKTGLLRSMWAGRLLFVVLGLLMIVIAVACAAEVTPAVDDLELVAEQVVDSPDAAELDVDSFAAINPEPEFRELDVEFDLGFYERERLPRDAIEPIYTPKFVSPDESVLRPDEIVMGLVINGDARAYPTGLLRAREMVNDEVGGTPVLVTW
jgi:hypothetical protein